MHKTSFVNAEVFSTEDAVSAVQSTTADVVAYLVEMGIEPGLLQLALRYESWDIRYLSGSEMAEHNVVTAPWDDSARTPEPQLDEPPVEARRPSEGEIITPEDARSGRVRRPKGYAPLMAEPSTEAFELRMLENGAAVAILGTTDRWYRVRAGEKLGWMHHTWVMVDQFHDDGFESKHVQIKSFENRAAVQSYLNDMPFALDVFIATNGWYAVTLDGSYSEDAAARLLSELKAGARIPDDSFQTYGNTYMQKICCD